VWSAVKRYSVIDIGSNSIRVMHAGLEGKRLVSCSKGLVMTRLGKGVNDNRQLSDETMKATCEALKLFSEEAESIGSELVGAFATSAVRDSSNRGEFIDMAMRVAGVDVTVIDGKREADLGYRGVISGVIHLMKDGAHENIMIIDIGGGSTEIIIGNENGIIYSRSYDMGSVRLSEMFVKSDPPSSHEISRLESFIMEYSSEVGSVCREYSPSMAVGIAGTITTIGAVSLEMDEYDRNRIHGLRLPFDEVKRIYGMFLGMDTETRKGIPGLQPKRADIIPAGTAILKCLMEMTGFDEVVISDYDNLEGVLVDMGLME
jgi:exopolyphosphatase / guanosine-5'-triphosphate,3'-diphosphate pyrophosphatase